MAIYQVSSYNNNSVLNKIPLKNGYIYHMTHIEHLPSILAHGLLSHNNPYKKHDISNKSANDKRERIEPIHNRSVHEYVPFYFNPRNAMLYVVQKEQGDNIVLLEIKKEILLLNGVIFTNGNAAAQSLGFADDIDDLLNPSFINWNEVFATSWNDANENVKNEKKFKMMAEVLVPDMVPSAMIAGIVCQNPSVCEKVAKLLNNSINTSWNSNLFFNVSGNNESFEFSANTYYEPYKPYKQDNISFTRKNFKYHPQTKDELKALVDDESIYLGDIDTSAITDMSSLFYESNRKDFSGIENWDVSNVTDMSGMFLFCKKFNQPLNSWDVSNVTNMNGMFSGCENFNQPLNSWNVSNVTDMSCMFKNCENFNQPLNSWNVSNVTDMSYMFSCCENFNQPLNSWDVSNVKNMSYMFFCCYNFNQPLNSWDVGNVENMSYMFGEGDGSESTGMKFNQPLDRWNVSKVTDMSWMFSICSDFNQPLDSWDVSNVTDMGAMFYACANFNQPLNSWNVGNVTDMSWMFVGCENFNQPLNSWNVSNVTNMNRMFWYCENFNQPLNSWNVSNVTNMNEMFFSCYNFNQSLNSWNVINVINMNCMFCHCKNYNKPLDLWDVSNVADMGGMFSCCENFNQSLNSWNIKNVKYLRTMFFGCNIDEKKLPNFTELQKKEIKIDEIPF